MSVLKRLAPWFDPGVRARGDQYFSRGCVRLVGAGGGRLDAVVQGTQLYNVRLIRGNGVLKVGCSCPYMKSAIDACKHVWGAMLAASAIGYLSVSGWEPKFMVIEGGDAPNPEDQDAGETGASDPDRYLDDDDEEAERPDLPEAARAHRPAYYIGHRDEAREAPWRSPLEERGSDPGDIESDPGEISQAFRPDARRRRPGGQPGPKPAPDQRGREKSQPPRGPRAGKPLDWRRFVSAVSPADEDPMGSVLESRAAERKLFYVVDIPATLQDQALIVQISVRERRVNGGWGKLKPLKMSLGEIGKLPDAEDRRILSLLVGGRSPRQLWTGYFDSDYEKTPSHVRIPADMVGPVFPILCASGRCLLRIEEDEAEPIVLRWDAGPPWEFALQVKPDGRGKRYVLSGFLRRGEERAGLEEPSLLLSGGMVLFGDEAARLEHFDAFSAISLLRRLGNVEVPLKEGEEMVTALLHLPGGVRLDLPEELRFEEVQGAPRPRLTIAKAGSGGLSPDVLRAELSFAYEEEVVPAGAGEATIPLVARRRVIRRDAVAERAAGERIRGLGFRLPLYRRVPPGTYEVHPRKFPGAVRALLADGWHIEAEGALYRRPGGFRMEVASGVDWFELRGGANFGDQAASLPQLLNALKRGETLIRLGDGSFGVLPEEWVAKYGPLSGTGATSGDHLRFGKTQVGLLDALLSAESDVSFDAAFERARKEILSFEGVGRAEAPPGFTGELRPYQKEGLGWLLFLQRFGFGGCLADDMGLGKTVQVLALLEMRREENESNSDARAALQAGAKTASETDIQTDTQTGAQTDAQDGGPIDPHSGAPSHAQTGTGSIAKKATRAGTKRAKGAEAKKLRPSLVVMPRSLIFNWKQEAARFAPKLRLLDYSGAGRNGGKARFDGFDVVLTTYGALRRDAAQYTDFQFDYVILDESQAIKNASTQSAKAARLLKADHRLALSGTPIENHLGELWSLFEFLNPGMLGGTSIFRLGGAGGRTLEDEARPLLARAIKPFVLRRTKEQVAKELPKKVEQTLYCELDTDERKLYNELKEHYRNKLVTRLDEEGMRKSKIQILEALLRLRQAACHPGLLDPARLGGTSAKLEMLLPQLEEILDEGHKVLVFSQFTSMLAIVRNRLDRDATPYAYLDGQTRDRQAAVERFQTDHDCKLFLISLKAGGLGLNLTAAEYVFLLDPWWNPAVEAQAIDRAHRIGQTRGVFAYRLVARDTVEEKILELQKTKRDLADAIIQADNNLIRNLSREDLELLLS